MPVGVRAEPSHGQSHASGILALDPDLVSAMVYTGKLVNCVFSEGSSAMATRPRTIQVGLSSRVRPSLSISTMRPSSRTWATSRGSQNDIEH